MSTKVETFPPGAGPGSITRSISLPKIFKTSSAVRVFSPPFLLALVAVNAHPAVWIKRRVHSFFGKRIPTFPVFAVKTSGNLETALKIKVSEAGQNFCIN